MKTQSAKSSPPRSPHAFTLIELLIVVSIIVILAALTIPALNRVSQGRSAKVALGELTQLETSIENYKSKLGFYPPDNPTNVQMAPLFFELSGTVLENGVYVSLDGSGSIPAANLLDQFGITGFANSSTTRAGSDDKPAPVNFLKDLKPTQTDVATGVRRLVSAVGKPDNIRWNYNSSNPTNNVGKYDLWVDLSIAGKTNRFSNWSKKPQILE